MWLLVNFITAVDVRIWKNRYTKHFCEDKISYPCPKPWYRHRMETVSALPVLSEGNPPVIGRFPSPRAINAGLDVIFDISRNKRWNEQSSRRWVETLNAHCDVIVMLMLVLVTFFLHKMPLAWKYAESTECCFTWDRFLTPINSWYAVPLSKVI